MSGNPYKKVPSFKDKVKKSLPQGADTVLDHLRNMTVKNFQKDTYAGMTEHLAVVLRTTEVPKTVTRWGANRLTDGGRATVKAVRARIISSNIHDYMPKPRDQNDNQIIDLYPMFELVDNHYDEAKIKANSYIRVQFYDRNNSSLRNANGQILGRIDQALSGYDMQLVYKKPGPPIQGPAQPPPGGGNPLPAPPPVSSPPPSSNNSTNKRMNASSPYYPVGSVPFQRTRAPANQHRGPDGSRGTGPIDLAAPQGSPLYAPLDGYVLRVYNQPPTLGNNGKKRGGGGIIVLAHPDNGGITTWYMHMSEFYYPVSGQNTYSPTKYPVKAGQAIGRSGGAPGTPGAGVSSGPHLHFEVRAGYNSQKLNALEFLSTTIRKKYT